MIRYAKVVVNTRVQPRRKVADSEPQGEENDSVLGMTFHYSIPRELRDEVQLGQLVTVPFGPRRLQGVIFGFDDASPVVETKDLHEIADLIPVLSPIHVELASWISRYYLAPLIDAVLLMLPPGIGRRTRITLRLNTERPLPPKQKPGFGTESKEIRPKVKAVSSQVVDGGNTEPPSIELRRDSGMHKQYIIELHNGVFGSQPPAQFHVRAEQVLVSDARFTCDSIEVFGRHIPVVASQHHQLMVAQHVVDTTPAPPGLLFKTVYQPQAFRDMIPPVENIPEHHQMTVTPAPAQVFVDDTGVHQEFSQDIIRTVDVTDSEDS